MPEIAQTISYGGLVILMGDGADPETFNASWACGLTQKTFTMTKNLTDTAVPYCDEPDKASAIERDVVSVDYAISSSGVMSKQALQAWTEAFLSDLPRNFKVIEPGAGVTITTTLPMHIGSLEKNGEKGGKWAVSLQMSAAGAATTVVT